MSISAGDWGPLFNWPLIGIHAILTPDNKVLTFGTNLNGAQGGLRYYDVWDPATNTHRTLTHVTQVDMFCAVALVVPATGKILIAGGDARPVGQVNYGVTSVLEYDYRDQTLVRSPDGEMAYPRWYPTAVTLADGTILVLGGKGGPEHAGMGASPYPELYTPGVGWKTLLGAADPVLQNNWNYPRAWLKSDGDVIVYGPLAGQGKGIYSIDPTGDGGIHRIGTLPFSVEPSLPSIMFEPDKVLAITANGVLRQIDFSGETPTYANVGSVGQTRYWSNMTLLADGSVMISGGSGVRNKLTNVTNQVAIWDPDTHAVTFGDSAAKARLYHSTTLMLPDATVLSLGGGAPGPLKNRNGEIYVPGYLLDSAGAAAARPEITEAPDAIDPFGTFEIRVDDPSDIDRLTFVKNGSTTHGFNMDTRFVELDFTVGADTVLTVDPPDNANILTPGGWMLFAIDDAGVPSLARTVKVEVGGQTMVAAARSFATLSGDAAPTASGSFKLAAAPEANRGAVLVNDPVDLRADASFAFDVKLSYCDCGDGVTFLLQTSRFGVHAPADVIDSGGLRLEIGATAGVPGHDHDGDHGHGGHAPATGHGHAEAHTTPEDAHRQEAAEQATRWMLTKAGKAVLAEDAWHRVEVSWDASRQSLSYCIDGAYAGKLSGPLLDAYLDGRTTATFGLVGARGTDGGECHEVRLVGIGRGGEASLIVGGSRGADDLRAGPGDDRIYGLRGADRLRGSGGDDVLHPGRDADRMRGGAGADTFVFASIGEAGRGAGSDAILDFAGGADSIDLRAIDADRQAAGNQAFRWLGSDAFDGEGGALRFDGGRLAGDVDGDGRADFAIRLEGVHAVAASDILL